MRIAMLLCLASCTTTNHWQAPREPGNATLICMNSCKGDAEDCAKQCPGVQLGKGHCPDRNDLDCEEYKETRTWVAVTTTAFLGAMIPLLAFGAVGDAISFEDR
jgi:hypothetical protein